MGNTFPGLSNDQWPTQDIKELLDTGALIYQDDQTEIVLLQALCEHYNFGLFTANEKYGTMHLHTFERLMERASFLDLSKFRWIPRSDFTNKSLNHMKFHEDELDNIFFAAIIASLLDESDEEVA